MFNSIEEIIELNEEMGLNFFNPDTMDFWDSTVFPEIYHGQFFITKERDYSGDYFRFTIREAKPTGRIKTVGEFQEYATFESARDALTIFFDELETD